MIAYIDIHFTDPVKPGDIDLGAFQITHSSGRSWILDVDQSYGGTDPRCRGCSAIQDLETFPKGDEYPYDLTTEDITSGDIKATLFIGREVNNEVKSIVYSVEAANGDVLAVNLTAEEE
jgi:hypothetical protein